MKLVRDNSNKMTTALCKRLYQTGHSSVLLDVSVSKQRNVVLQPPIDCTAKTDQHLR